MSTELDQIIARAETILAQCIVAANQAAAAAASIGSAGLAPLESPLFTGDPRAPTPASADASASIATTAWIAAKLGQPNGLSTLDTGGLIPLSQLPFSGLASKGTWNAASNTPTLSAGTAGNANGDFYIVTVSGSTNLDGITTWAVGDWALFSGGVWTRVPYVTPPVSNLPLSSLEGIAAGRVVANTMGGSASPQAVTIASLMGYMGVVTTGGSGWCPTLPGGTGVFLRGDGSYVSPGAPDLSAYALLASPAFTGTATVGTQPRGTNSSAIANTQFVLLQLGGTGEASLIKMAGSTSSGTSTYGSPIDHIHPVDTSRAAASNPVMAGSAGIYTGTLTIGPRIVLSGTLTMSGTMTLTGTATINGSLTVNGTAVITGALSTGALTPSSLVGAVVAEGNLSFTDLTTNNSTTSKHGLLPKLNNSATSFLDGQGNWSTPSTGQPIPSSSSFAVGTLLFLQVISPGGSAVANGASCAGSNLTLVSIDASSGGVMIATSVNPAGTWKNVSGNGVDPPTASITAGYFVRTA